MEIYRFFTTFAPMTRQEFEKLLENNARSTATVRARAHKAHSLVNQHYDRTHPYGLHLDMVARNVMDYGHLVLTDPDELPALIFAAYFHDAIEDARLSYNDMLQLAGVLVGETHKVLATEIIYALTNEKGRTRAERANEAYYAGIRKTPYAPFVKLADRLANATYSRTMAHKSTDSHRMVSVYSRELPHFLEAITDDATTDPRLRLPADMVKRLKGLLDINL